MMPQLVTLGGYAFISFEYADKIGWIVKACLQSGLRDRNIAGKEQHSCVFDPVKGQVLHGCAAGQPLKVQTKVIWVHSGHIG